MAKHSFGFRSGVAGLAMVAACNGSGAESDQINEFTVPPTNSHAETTIIADIPDTSTTNLQVGSNIELRPELTAYLYTEAIRAEFADIASNLGRIVLSFDKPSATGEIDPLNITSALESLISTVGSETELSIAIGGWGESDEIHNQMNVNWRIAVNNPEFFAAAVAKRVDDLETQTGREVNGVDFDWEYPMDESEREGYTALIAAVRGRLPDAHLTIAIPPWPSNIDLQELDAYINEFHIMTYDHAGGWSPMADDIAPGKWVIETMDTMIRQNGLSPAKVKIGFPTYGYIFNGASQRGDIFTDTSGIGYNQILAGGAVIDNPEGLTSECTIQGNWTSCLSPEMARLTYLEILKLYPDIGGAFFWSASGLTKEHLEITSY